MLADVLFQGDSKSSKGDTVLFSEKRKILLRLENQITYLLALADLVPVRGVLATYAANHFNAEPLWVMLVAPPASGKTVLLSTLFELPNVAIVSDITKGGFLSGTATREKSKSATGGLLKEMGEFGIIVFKDFTSIITKNRDACNEVIGAMREIADGYYSRHFGVDGGTSKLWEGKAGVIAGVTPAIEHQRTVMSSMGDRFIFIRMYADDNLRMLQAQKGLEVSGCESTARKLIRETAAELYEGIEPGIDSPTSMKLGIRNSIAPLAGFVACCRTPVERNGYSKEPEMIHAAEGFARLSKQFLVLFGGCLQIGCSLSEAWEVARRSAIDTIPETRCKIIEAAYTASENFSREFHLNDLIGRIRASKSTLTRTLEDLYYTGVFECSRGNGRTANTYRFSDRTEEQITAIALNPFCESEMSEDPLPSCGLPENRIHKSDEEKECVNDAA